MNKRNVWASMATAGGQRNIASFAAIRAIVKTVGAKAHVVLAFADGAVPFAGAAIFRQLALRAICWSLHKGPLQKTLPEHRRHGKAKVMRIRRVTSVGPWIRPKVFQFPGFVAVCVDSIVVFLSP